MATQRARPALWSGGARRPVAVFVALLLAGAAFAAEPAPSDTAGTGWILSWSAPSTLLRDIAFAGTSRGFAAGERGLVLRTRDGGRHWDPVLSIGTLVHWNAVDALSPDTVVVAGTDVAAGRAILRWSFDGGTTWEPIVAAGADFGLLRARFGDSGRAVAARLPEGDAGWEELPPDVRIRSCTAVSVGADSLDLWCCGYTRNLEGRIYHRRTARAAGVSVPSADPKLPSRSPSSSLPSGLGVRSFPNPFSPATTLSFTIARPESVLIEIFAPSGRVVRRFRPGLLGTGTHQFRWNGKDEEGERVGSGVYFYRLQAGAEVSGGTLVLVR